VRVRSGWKQWAPLRGAVIVGCRQPLLQELEEVTEGPRRVRLPGSEQEPVRIGQRLAGIECLPFGEPDRAAEPDRARVGGST
jgi:hypothetical protein